MLRRFSGSRKLRVPKRYCSMQTMQMTSTNRARSGQTHGGTSRHQRRSAVLNEEAWESDSGICGTSLAKADGAGESVKRGEGTRRKRTAQNWKFEKVFRSEERRVGKECRSRRST